MVVTLYIKQVNPDALAIGQWWGRGSLEAQAKGLAKLGDMAPQFTYENGELTTADAGQYTPGQFWSTWAKGSWRLGTPMNDIRPWNIGANGKIFDPALHPVQQGIYWFGAGATAATAATAGYVASQNNQGSPPPNPGEGK